MLEMQTEVDQLIKAIHATERYKEYHRTLCLLKEDQEVKKEVDIFRKNVFLFQSSSLDRISYEEQHELELERDRLNQNPLVEEFLAAEVAFCNMIQAMQQTIITSFDFD